MNDLTGTRLQLLRALVELAREMPPGTLRALTSALESGDASQNLARYAATQSMKEKLRRLDEIRTHRPEIDDRTIAFALQAAAQAAVTVVTEQRVDIAWTGPGTESVPLRRVDQVVYDLVESAKNEVFLVSYAAYKADRAMSTLRDAAERGVEVKLVIELAQESGGKISFDGLHMIRTRVPLAQVFYWSPDRRPHNAGGSIGAMHAKCLIADRHRALVSSANLTGYALEVNMELGLLVEGITAKRLADHFDQLMFRGELISAF